MTGLLWLFGFYAVLVFAFGLDVVFRPPQPRDDLDLDGTGGQPVMGSGAGGERLDAATRPSRRARAARLISDAMDLLGRHMSGPHL